jgi:putative nucleotidyltransferase with HDIG domain
VTGKEWAPLRGHTSRTVALACCRGIQILASVSADRTVRVWDTSRNKQIACIVAQVTLLDNLSGFVVIADKLAGDFDAEDVETVLSVGDSASALFENHQLRCQLENAYLTMISVLADAVEAKDPYTRGHCELVARYSRQIAVWLELSDHERAVVSFGGLLHDIGKIGISDGILNKPGKLLPEEWELMCSHVRIGRDLLARIPFLEKVADVVLHHHEAFGGNGYPDNLEGEAISLAARIVKVADAYCAMISRRSYKEAFPHEDAVQELVRGKGTQFDPDVVDAFLAVLTQERTADESADSFFCEGPLGTLVEDFPHLSAGSCWKERPAVRG